ncbi:DUF2817 domain-containing protein [Vibrio sp. CAU 1672]|uniref:DUF2817 domain-containing protein n=1 Tax=Vibrio sp. CAU 1672 TaxID=3032594 RepID=UPI0023DB94CA|nr:DUF2817 domain-containing protein [Vibrio sp. CAU 1672]MDF2152283.1 DUF2817 domain-containing protein [Vibrio sp. CAU 1672]
MKRQVIVSTSALCAVVLAIGIYQLGSMGISHCDSGLAVGVDSSDLGSQPYFSPDYLQAREKFLSVVNKTGGTIESIPFSHTGPEGKPLFMDVALLGAQDAKQFVLVMSGIHGVEGFAGSAIQTGVLSEGIAWRLPADTAY